MAGKGAFEPAVSGVFIRVTPSWNICAAFSCRSRTMSFSMHLSISCMLSGPEAVGWEPPEKKDFGFGWGSAASEARILSRNRCRSISIRGSCSAPPSEEVAEEGGGGGAVSSWGPSAPPPGGAPSPGPACDIFAFAVADSIKEAKRSCCSAGGRPSQRFWAVDVEEEGPPRE